jgi:hypothetical protein
MPGVVWFATQKWWDRKEKFPAAAETKPVTVEQVTAALETEHFEI